MHTDFRLSAQKLRSRCNIDHFSFENTTELKPLKGIMGQKRAVEALYFGLKMKKKGYNIYVSGLSGTGRSSYANSIAEKFAEKTPVPYDWLYVYNFKHPDRPRALSMEPGMGAQFKKEMESMIEKFEKEIPEIFRSMEYETGKNEIYRLAEQKNQKMVKELNDKAREYGFLFTPTEQGLLTTPLKDGRPMTQEEYEGLSIEEIEDLRERSRLLNLKTMTLFNGLRSLEEELWERIKRFDEEMCYRTVNYYIKQFYKKYGHHHKVLEYINELEKDIIEHVQLFKAEHEVNELRKSLKDSIHQEENFLERYQVNLFIDNSELKHAPIINEANPTFSNLLGTIEYKNQMGVLKTDFMQIKPGALHSANGGFLILQVREILGNPYAWETLKRALKTEEINIESFNKQMGYVVTSTLKPESIPVDLKVILVGDINTYYWLFSLDEDFKKLFKVMADFDVEMDRTDENVQKMAQFIANHCEKEGLKPFDKTAVARVVEYSSRLADHQDKLTSRFNQIVEILYEADLWAAEDGANLISKYHVEKAIREKVYRNNKYEEKLNEMFMEDTLLIDVEGEKIGQINGLAVIGTGEYSFGRPSRITVSTYRGKPGIISIEREVKKSGSIHDKGVLVLSGYLGEKYAQEHPMALAVSISFEQNYSIIDGDSASSTELYGILSSIAQVPIKQYIAVTGSVNQKGEIQPIGGVNEKIEGFFDICKQKGLTGRQGVLIPKQNVKNLMLKEEVIEAIEKGEFHVYAIGHVDEGIKILTGIEAGTLNENGEYPPGTINYLVSQRLKSTLSHS